MKVEELIKELKKKGEPEDEVRITMNNVWGDKVEVRESEKGNWIYIGE